MTSAPEPRAGHFVAPSAKDTPVRRRRVALSDDGQEPCRVAEARAPSGVAPLSSTRRVAWASLAAASADRILVAVIISQIIEVVSVHAGGDILAAADTS